jgi:hypothetical protein
MIGRVLAVTGVLLGCAAGPLAAQTNPFARVRSGQTVRVRLVPGQRFVVRLGVEGDTTARLPASLVDSVWVRGNAALVGALVGGGIGGAGTFAFFLALCNALSDGGGCDEGGVVVALGLGGAAGGALLGGVIGMMVPKWRLRYARDRNSAVRFLVAPGRVGLGLRF